MVGHTCGRCYGVRSEEKLIQTGTTTADNSALRPTARQHRVHPDTLREKCLARLKDWLRDVAPRL